MKAFFLSVPVTLLASLLLSCGSAPGNPGSEALSQVLLPSPMVAASDPETFLLPYAEVEAESGRTTGTFSSYSTSLHSPGAEASGRRFVRLPPGGRLVLTSPIDADSLVVRTSYPDAAEAVARTGTLQVVIGTNEPVAISVTSQYSWEYGKPNWGSSDVWGQDSGYGDPRHFWDETNIRTPAFTAGTEVALINPQSGVTVLVDLVDFEKVPAAVSPPPGSVSFADSSPDGTGKTDVTVKLQKALDASRGKTLYIPEGTYRIETVYADNVTVVGAGLWRTRFVGPLSQFRFTGKTAHLADFAIFGETNTRNDTSDEENGLAGNPGPGSTVSRLWIEHKKCAYWVGNWGSKTPVTNLTLAECRFRNTMADGVNLCSGTNGTTVQDCLFRNTGDDALAAWSPKNGGPPGGNNSLVHNYIQLPWVANGIALYGGGPFVVEENTVKDTVTTGSGIYLSANFGAWPFAGVVTVKKNLLIRAGSHESDPHGPTGAIRILGGDLDMRGGTYLFTNNTVIAPLESAVSIQGPRNVGSLVFDGLVVEALGDEAVVVDVRSNAAGKADFYNVVFAETTRMVWQNSAEGDFHLNH